MTSADIQIKREATDEIMKEEIEDYNMSKETIMEDEEEVTGGTEGKDPDLIDMFKGHSTLQNGTNSALDKNSSSPEAAVEAVDYTVRRREDVMEDPIHHGIFQCSQCNFRTENEQEYFHHSEEHAPDRDFICIVCNRKFSKKQSLRRHMNLHSGHRPFKCPLCEYRSSRKDHLQLHLRTRHAPGKATNYQFKCVICGNSYQSQKRMIMHMKSHQRTHRCDICGMTFPSFTAMDSHKKAKHVMPTTPVSNGSPYTCHACGFMSTSAQGYHIHLQSQRHKDVITASVRIPQVLKSSIEDEKRDDRIEMTAVSFPGPIPISMRPMIPDGPQRLPPTLSHLHNPRVFPHHQIPGPHFPIRPEFFSPVFGFPRPDFPRPEFRSEHKSAMPVILADVSSLRLSPAASETISTGSPSQSVSPSYNRTVSPSYNASSPTSSPLMQMPGLLMKSSQDSPRSVFVSSASPVSPHYTSVNVSTYNQGDEASPKSVDSKSRTSSFDSGHETRPEPTQYNMATSSGTRDNATQDDIRRCKHCHTVYPDDVMYGIHLGCHGVNHPFECNICGQICCDKYDFATHITRSLHKK
ncbi:zinc finger protein Pegasus-like isoform X1 [Anneissia japonica]|uniref:zinc finger protein Pegasus-like isoform X1 n=1 Tax=Anneissia japonica TaxID=1529436 RepID=UPI0014259625|nr:zinc finger protein Pegasus-like isoform X1 [Anneissia japonica]XP_033127883.1 zinc finger protein Pegasus-like isoform X1 [Anneissia japonica]XP_033127884.1 zinc finger protein Pegasus-like isoform X1 [Anneissia japonica]XP_033127885.1 zinc finger protein Pegasus-like isoform X1 [Anneissia japonica]